MCKRSTEVYSREHGEAQSKCDFLRCLWIVKARFEMRLMCIHFFFFFVFQDIVPLYNPGCLWNYIEQASLKFKSAFLCLPRCVPTNTASHPFLESSIGNVGWKNELYPSIIWYFIHRWSWKTWNFKTALRCFYPPTLHQVLTHWLYNAATVISKYWVSPSCCHCIILSTHQWF